VADRAPDRSAWTRPITASNDSLSCAPTGDAEDNQAGEQLWIAAHLRSPGQRTSGGLVEVESLDRPLLDID
jgi:hypothetical protein